MDDQRHNVTTDQCDLSEKSDEPSGRAAELARLTSVIDAATPGVQVIQLSGDAWIGKTRLLVALTEIAQHHNWTVLAGSADVGSCSPPDGIPFGAFANVVDGRFGQGRTWDLTGLSNEHRKSLTRIFASLGGSAPNEPVDTEADPVDAIHALLCTLASPDGLLLVVDDLQQIDQGSLDLLDRLVRQPPAGRFVLALAYRRRQLGLQAQGLLAEMRENHRHVELELTPLSDKDAVELLPHDLDDPHKQSVLKAGGGNPGVVRALGSVGVLPDGLEDSLHRLPRETLAACFRDFRTLSRLGWLAVRAAAVHVGPVEADMIRVVAELTEAEFWIALDEVTAADVLRVDEGAHTLRFRDPLIRAAAYRSASTGWRIGAHRRAATWLRSRSAPAIDVAHHLLGTDDVHDETDVQVLLDAAEQVLWHRPTRAASWVRAAIGSTSPDRATTTRERLLLGKSLTLAGPAPAAVAVLNDVEERNLEVAEHRSDLVHWRSLAARLCGQHDNAAAQVRRALRMLPAEQTNARLLLHAELTAIALERNADPDPADTTAIRTAVMTADIDTAFHAYLVALLALVGGERPATTFALRAVGKLADELPDNEIIRFPHTLCWVGRAEILHGRLDAGRAHLLRGIEIARRRSLTGLIPAPALELAALTAQQGELDAAAAHAAEAAQAALLIESTVLLEAAHDLQAQIAEGTVPGLGKVPSRPPVRLPVSRPPADEGTDAPHQLNRLSERELEIAVLVSKGRTNQQIAHALKLSHKTVETYLARIFKKLGVCSRTQVATLIGQENRQPVPVNSRQHISASTSSIRSTSDRTL